jgi:magnesium transporter
VIRDSAVHPRLPVRLYFIRHFIVVLTMAVLLAAALWVGSYFFYGDAVIASVLSLALFFAVVSSVFTGLIIPYVFMKLKQDPANASGPMATIAQDLLSVTIYLLIATWLL